MSTENFATVYITNKTGGNAYIQMSHKYSSYDADCGAWQAAPDETVGPIKVYYKTGFGTLFDFWYCNISVQDGKHPGIYACAGTLLNPVNECMLESSDAGTTFTNEVSTSGFKVAIPSGGNTFSMTKLASYAPVSNIFVFMLENHSFDHLLGFSGLPGVKGLTGDESNTVSSTGKSYKVVENANDPMPIGPGHEFMDTLGQLCGTTVANPFPKGPYPTISNSGFIDSYVEMGASTATSSAADQPQASDVMHCCNSAQQVPVLYWLAKEFAVCDTWYSSMPGPTWPNRLFAMGGSSAGLDDSPSTGETVEWEFITGFKYENGSIFDAVQNNNHNYRCYNDFWNKYDSRSLGQHTTGSFAIVSGLDHISVAEVHGFDHFAQDINGQYPYQYTWIEPNYGNADEDFAGGSSQHPVDSLAAGEAMLQDLYQTLRTSPYWATSLLIVTYDEHGGFYDHVAPPAAVKPGDKIYPSLNTNGFDFSQYGIRVPAVVISPRIPAGTVDHTVYDHTSIMRTVEKVLGFGHLTERDHKANDLRGLMSLATPRYAPARVDGPEVVVEIADAYGVPLPPTINPDYSMKVLPERGNIHGFVRIAAKTDYELSDRTEAEKARIVAKVRSLETVGQAREYIANVLDKVVAHKAAQNSVQAMGAKSS